MAKTSSESDGRFLFAHLRKSGQLNFTAVSPIFSDALSLESTAMLMISRVYNLSKRIEIARRPRTIGAGLAIRPFIDLIMTSSKLF